MGQYYALMVFDDMVGEDFEDWNSRFAILDVDVMRPLMDAIPALMDELASVTYNAKKLGAEGIASHKVSLPAGAIVAYGKDGVAKFLEENRAGIEQTDHWQEFQAAVPDSPMAAEEFLDILEEEWGSVCAPFYVSEEREYRANHAAGYVTDDGLEDQKLAIYDDWACVLDATTGRTCGLSPVRQALNEEARRDAP